MPELSALLEYDSYEAFDGVLRPKPMASVVMQILAQEVRVVRNLRVREEADAEMAATTTAATTTATIKPQAPRAGGLADHVKAQLRTFGPSAVSVAPVLKSIAASTSTTAPSHTRTFLESASDRSRSRDLDRRRNLITVTSRVGLGGGEGISGGGGGGVHPLLTTRTFSVCFKYHEGFTNAVRRPVKIRDF